MAVRDSLVWQHLNQAICNICKKSDTFRRGGKYILIHQIKVIHNEEYQEMKVEKIQRQKKDSTRLLNRDARLKSCNQCILRITLNQNMKA